MHAMYKIIPEPQLLCTTSKSNHVILKLGRQGSLVVIGTDLLVAFVLSYQ